MLFEQKKHKIFVPFAVCFVLTFCLLVAVVFFDLSKVVQSPRFFVLFFLLFIVAYFTQYVSNVNPCESQKKKHKEMNHKCHNWFYLKVLFQKKKQAPGQMLETQKKKL